MVILPVGVQISYNNLTGTFHLVQEDWSMGFCAALGIVKSTNFTTLLGDLAE